MRTESTIEFDAELGALQFADHRLVDFSRLMGWTERALFQVRLVVEELLMNIISHGSDGQHRPRIRLQLAQDDNLLRLEIADDGIAFDPLQALPPDLEADLDDRPIGGLGVHLVRQLSDNVAYRRVDGWNRLEVTKTL